MKQKSKFKQTEIGMIPEEWEIKEIQEVSTKLGDGLHGTPKYDDEGEYYFINGNNLVDGKIQFNENTKRCSKEEFEKNKKDLNDRTILVSINGTLGNIALYNREKVFLGKSVCYFNVKREFNLLFLKYVLKNNYFQNYILFNATGTTIKNVSLKQMREFKFGIPNNFEEQQSIAKIFFDLDSKIELNQQMNKTLETIGQAIFKRWFIDFEFPNEKGKPYKSSGGEMVFNEELGKDIPKGWSIILLQNFIDFLEGPGIRNWQYASEGIKFINIRLIKNNDIDISSANFVSEEEVNSKYRHFLLQENDMVVSTSGTLGRTAIVRKSHLPLMLNTSVIRFRPIDGVSYPFIYQYLNSDIFSNELISKASGSVQLNFGPVHLKAIKMIIPSKKVLDQFNLSLKNIYLKIIHNLDETDNLSQIRDSLLPKLMSGKIRVPVEIKA